MHVCLSVRSHACALNGYVSGVEIAALVRTMSGRQRCVRTLCCGPSVRQKAPERLFYVEYSFVPMGSAIQTIAIRESKCESDSKERKRKHVESDVLYQKE